MGTGDFLTVAEVAQKLGLTRQTVSKFINAKELNAIKMNKTFRIHPKDFNTFIQKKTTSIQNNLPYLKKTRNCSLEYQNKTSEEDILSLERKGRIKLVSRQHKSNFNQFIFGDNFDVLNLLQDELRGKIDLIYIDPPFGTGQDFVNINNHLAYSDKLVNSEFLDFLRKRLILLREMLSSKGSIYLHIDKKIGHYVKILMDEIFGYENFINDITRIKCNPKNFSRNAFGNFSDMILFYAKERDKNIWNDIKHFPKKKEIEELFPKVHIKYGRYTTTPLHAPGETVDGDTGQKWKGLSPPKGRHWRYSRVELTRLDKEGLIEWSETGNPRKIIFAKDHHGVKIQDVWEMKDKGLSYVEYPTQKNHNLLERIILNSSNADSIILDCFAGSGSTMQIAHKLKRNWIGIDNSIQSYNVIKRELKRKKIRCNYYEYQPS